MSSPKAWDTCSEKEWMCPCYVLWFLAWVLWQLCFLNMTYKNIIFLPGNEFSSEVQLMAEITHPSVYFICYQHFPLGWLSHKIGRQKKSQEMVAKLAISWIHCLHLIHLPWTFMISKVVCVLSEKLCPFLWKKKIKNLLEFFGRMFL